MRLFHGGGAGTHQATLLIGRCHLGAVAIPNRISQRLSLAAGSALFVNAAGLIQRRRFTLRRNKFLCFSAARRKSSIGRRAAVIEDPDEIAKLGLEDEEDDDEEEDSSAQAWSKLQLDRKEDGSIRKALITTPLFYANGPPHMGSAYPTMVADAFARYCRMRAEQGSDVKLITGMDEHGEKIARTAADASKEPQELVDTFAEDFKSLWSSLDIDFSRFARTTSDRHKAIVAEFWQRCLDKGDIYTKEYEGLYCVGCEAYLHRDELDEGDICKIHRTKCELRKEENYFFRLSRYWDDVVKLVADPESDFIHPPNRAREVLPLLDDDCKRDFSISRSSTKWGIPVPGDDSQVIYVWFDALLGYISCLLEDDDEATLEAAVARGWPADVHVIGRDILRFHAVYWPAMLMSAGLPLPRHLCVHGILLKDGTKMGKSLGNVLEPTELVDNFGANAVRYYFCSGLQLELDSDFRYKGFTRRANATLANGIGNLTSRILGLCRKNLKEPCTARAFEDNEEELLEHPVYLSATIEPTLAAEEYDQLHFGRAIGRALDIMMVCNQMLTIMQPWAKFKSDSEEERRLAFRELLLQGEALRILALVVAPVMPGLSQRMLVELGVMSPEDDMESLRWSDTEWRWDPLPGLASGGKPKPLFPRIDLEAWDDK